MLFEVKLLGRKVGFDGPETAEAFDALTSPGRCLELAMRDIMYRPVASAYRKAYVEWLEKTTEQKRKVTGKKKKKGGEDGADILETEEDYVDRVKAEGFTAEGYPDFTSLSNGAHDAGMKAVGDLSEFIKKAGDGRSAVGKVYLERAEETIARWGSGESDRDKFVAKIRTVLGDEWDLTEDPTVEEVALAIKAFATADL